MVNQQNIYIQDSQVEIFGFSALKLSVAFKNISLYKYIFMIKAGGQVFISEVIYLQFGAALLEM